MFVYFSIIDLSTILVSREMIRAHLFEFPKQYLQWCTAETGKVDHPNAQIARLHFLSVFILVSRLRCFDVFVPISISRLNFKLFAWLYSVVAILSSVFPRSFVSRISLVSVSNFIFGYFRCDICSTSEIVLRRNWIFISVSEIKWKQN